MRLKLNFRITNEELGMDSSSTEYADIDQAPISEISEEQMKAYEELRESIQKKLVDSTIITIDTELVD